MVQIVTPSRPTGYEVHLHTIAFNVAPAFYFAWASSAGEVLTLAVSANMRFNVFLDV